MGRKVCLTDGKVAVLPNIHDLQKLQINEYNGSYLGIAPKYGTHDVSKSLELYLLHQIPIPFIKDVTKPVYIWVSVWNSATWTSVRGVESWNTIEDALTDAINNGWKIKKMTIEDFSDIINHVKAG